MIVRYLNYQDKTDPLNGKEIEKNDELLALLDDRRNRRPFIAELVGNNGFQITFGIGPLCVVQHSAADGSPPYLMAVSPRPPIQSGYLTFLAAGTPTPFAARYIISFDELKEIAVYFLQAGKTSPSVSWEVLNPRAVKEDAERA